VAVLGIISIIIPLIIFLYEIPQEKDAPTDLGFPAQSSFNLCASAITTIVFAFQGQTIFPELMGK
jgi:amino acid permease